MAPQSEMFFTKPAASEAGSRAACLSIGIPQLHSILQSLTITLSATFMPIGAFFRILIGKGVQQHIGKFIFYVVSQAVDKINDACSRRAVAVVKPPAVFACAVVQPIVLCDRKDFAGRIFRDPFSQGPACDFKNVTVAEA